ncbi:DgyrCDS5942 [Dimorphilus gyrociliatus]|uniref:DgyrCDS5942 n=1 Tax=Dimorphilus gyrociliatus TaxID=2664684 RepID=A0A7I8VLG7_9ANNE|nr:DgyrCDS5942 [Dimorphilus gyrociliatus]
MSADESEESYGYSSDDSDKEVLVAYEKGLLKADKLNIEQEKREFINKIDGLKSKTEEFKKKDLPWPERLDLTVAPAMAPSAIKDQILDNPEDINDDFKREMYFHRLAQAALVKGLPRLKAFNIPTKRPDDYLAEMAKSDAHMTRVRENLITKKLSLERSEKAKKLREMRKFGKQVQQEVLAKRQKEKKEMMDAVKKYRKGKKESLEFLEGDEKKGKDKNKNKNKKTNTKRDKKNAKFGFGGQKKRSKYNTKNSVDAVYSDFKTKKNAMTPGKAKQAKRQGQKRPGKQRRQKARGKK